MPCKTKSIGDETYKSKDSGRELELFFWMYNNKNNELAPDSQEENSSEPIEVNREPNESNESEQSSSPIISLGYFLTNRVKRHVKPTRRFAFLETYYALAAYHDLVDSEPNTFEEVVMSKFSKE